MSTSPSSTPSLTSRRLLRSGVRAVVDHPFTAALVVSILLASWACGTFTSHVDKSTVGFGLPELRDGQWWKFLTGALVVPSASLLPIAGGLVAVVSGALERRIGARRTALTLLGAHLAGTVGTALFLAVSSTAFDWRWVDGLAQAHDTGLSAGGVGGLAVLTAFLQPSARRTVRVGLGVYLVVILVRSGVLWDVEHLLAFGAGLAVGPWVAGRVPVRAVRRGSRIAHVRDAAALLLVATAITELVEAWFPGVGGPFGPGRVADATTPAVALAIVLVVVALPWAHALRRGSELAWNLLLLETVVLLGLHALGLVTMSPGDLLIAGSQVALVLWHHGAVRAQPQRVRAATDLEQRIVTHGGGSLGWQHTWTGSQSWVSEDGAVALTYRAVSGVAIVVGDPVGPRAGWPAAVEEFRASCENRGLTPAWYAVTDAFVGACEGWSTLQIGEDTVIELGALEFKGRSWQDVRTARNRATKEGIAMQVVSLHDADPVTVAQVREISDAWVADKPLPEMGFTLGGVREALDPHVRTHVAVDEQGRVHGVTTWMPVHRDGRVVGWTLDLMRRRSDGFRPVMEFLIAESVLTFQHEGYETVSLSVAPLARRTPGCAGPLDRVLETASTVLEPTYGFRSLLGFKAKFDPAYRPVHLAYASGLDLPLISLAVGRAYLPDLTMSQLGHLAGEIGRPMLARAGLARAS